MGTIIHGIKAEAQGNNKALVFETENRKTGSIVFNGDGFVIEGITFQDGVISGADLDVSADLGSAPTPVTTRTNNPIIGTNLPNANIDALDAAIGADNTVVPRTNNPTVANTTLNAKVQALDGAIGITPVVTVRTVGPILAANSVSANLTALDVAIGTDAQLTAVGRTAGPISASQSINQNIDDLDAAIGADPTPAGTRTAGAITAAGTVNANIDALDASIGFEAQMSGTPHVVTKTGTVFQMLDQLDTYKSVQTIKKTIGGVGVAGCDFNFATAENTTEQVIDLGAIIPAKARIVDVFTFTDAVFTGATSLVADIGTTSGGAELIGSATIYAANAIIAAANAGAFIATPAATATNIYVNATPGANWNLVTAGKVSVYVTFINVTNI